MGITSFAIDWWFLYQIGTIVFLSFALLTTLSNLWTRVQQKSLCCVRPQVLELYLCLAVDRIGFLDAAGWLPGCWPWPPLEAQTGSAQTNSRSTVALGPLTTKVLSVWAPYY